MTYRLIGMTPSVATQRVLWAFDYTEVPYQFEEYIPQISTPWLRLRTHKLRGPISVPVLLGEQGLCLLDSWDIALQVSQDQPMAGLIPTLSLDQIQAMNQLSEAIFNAARMLLIGRILPDDEALMEAFPASFPSWARKPMLPVMRRTFKMLGKKYGEPGSSQQDQLQSLTASLQALRQQLDGKPYLLDRGFCYADMTVIAALAMVSPVRKDPQQPPSPYERANTCTEVLEPFADIFSWRDGVVAKHRYRSYLGNPV